jgi:hypothetical protein
MIRCLCEWWKYRAKTLAWGGVGAGASIARRIYRIVWLRVGIAVSVAECFYGLGTGVLIICLCYLLPGSAPAATPRLIPTSLNLIRFPRATPALVRFRRTSHVAPLSTDVRRLTAHTWGGLCGVGPRVGTSKPTSPLGRRRRYLGSVWVFDAEKYAHRLGAAPHPTCPNPGRIGRVSFKQSWLNNHGWALPALG